MKIPAFLMIGILALLCSCGGGGGSTSSNPITNPQPTQSNPAPSISSLSPNSATAGSSAFTLTVNGSNFISSSAVQWNGASRQTTFTSSTQLQAAISAADIASAGTVQVAVSNPAPGGGTSNVLMFTVNNRVNSGSTAPRIFSITPASTAAGSGSFTLTVKGINFTPTSVVRWDGSDRATVFMSSSQLEASISATDINTKGIGEITVFTPGAGSSMSAIFTVAGPFGGQVSFTLQNLPSGGGGESMATGDFNSDGITDIAATDLFPLSVNLAFGDGRGGFSVASDIPLQAKNVISGDFNRDGKSDLAFTTLPLGFSLSEVAVYVGDGHGNFTPSWQYGYPLNSPCRQQVQGELQAIAEADVNNDGIPDLIVGHVGFSVFLGNGDGTFAEPKNFGCDPSVDSESSTIVAADFNKNGNIDVAIVDRLRDQLSIWLGDGTGNFTAMPLIPHVGGVFGGSLITADFDLDGNPDLSAKAGSNLTFIYFGNGDGTFIGPIGLVSTEMAPNFVSPIMSLAAADLNGDNIPDLVMSGPADFNLFGFDGTVIEVFLGTGNRNQGFILNKSGAAFEGGPSGIATIDVDRDGRLDIVLAGIELLNKP